ncbi:MAG: Rrf2 family transcriptional regulator [Proteobacteria bacterium]|nr:Rrf2 family transcriptional regulator [Pseudomonadota bacterium]
MKLQKASRFALYAVLELARDTSRQMSVTELADHFGISSNHLAKVLPDLARAGLVDSVRGAGGGYRFCGNAKRTTVLDVINLFESIGDDSVSSRDEAFGTDIGQALGSVLDEIDDIARATFGSITIDTLIKSIRRAQERQSRANP